MINIKELSIGNYVMSDDNGIGKIEEISLSTSSVLCNFIYIDYVDYEFLGNIEPIQITPKILEEDGWKLGEFSSATLVLEDKIVVVEFYKFGTHLGIFKGAEDEDLQILDIMVDGVHQLQNALTLCGINKEIKL